MYDAGTGGENLRADAISVASGAILFLEHMFCLCLFKERFLCDFLLFSDVSPVGILGDDELHYQLALRFEQPST
jgi:hypothetical protein